MWPLAVGFVLKGAGIMRGRDGAGIIIFSFISVVVLIRERGDVPIQARSKRAHPPQYWEDRPIPSGILPKPSSSSPHPSSQTFSTRPRDRAAGSSLDPWYPKDRVGSVKASKGGCILSVLVLFYSLSVSSPLALEEEEELVQLPIF